MWPVKTIKEIIAPELAPLITSFIDPTSGDNDMHTQLVIETSAVGMQYRHHCQFNKPDFGELALPSATDAKSYELKLSIPEKKLENNRSCNPAKIL